VGAWGRTGALAGRLGSELPVVVLGVHLGSQVVVGRLCLLGAVVLVAELGDQELSLVGERELGRCLELGRPCLARGGFACCVWVTGKSTMLGLISRVKKVFRWAG
jgi:hypothetical protein